MKTSKKFINKEPTSLELTVVFSNPSAIAGAMDMFCINCWASSGSVSISLIVKSTRHDKEKKYHLTYTCKMNPVDLLKKFIDIIW